MDKVEGFFGDSPSASTHEPEPEVKIDGVTVPSSLRDQGMLPASDLNDALLNVLLERRASFKLIAVSDHSQMIRRLEEQVEKRGLTCRIYTENRGYIAGGAAVLTGVGLAAVAAIAAHNLATWNPDYEIVRDIVDNKISVIFKKNSKRVEMSS